MDLGNQGSQFSGQPRTQETKDLGLLGSHGLGNPGILAQWLAMDLGTRDPGSVTGQTWTYETRDPSLVDSHGLRNQGSWLSGWLAMDLGNQGSQLSGQQWFRKPRILAYWVALVLGTQGSWLSGYPWRRKIGKIVHWYSMNSGNRENWRPANNRIIK